MIKYVQSVLSSSFIYCVVVVLQRLHYSCRVFHILLRRDIVSIRNQFKLLLIDELNTTISYYIDDAILQNDAIQNSNGKYANDELQYRSITHSMHREIIDSQFSYVAFSSFTPFSPSPSPSLAVQFIFIWNLYIQLCRFCDAQNHHNG